MYLNFLSDSLSWGDRLNYMGVGVLLGVVVVFAVLIILWLTLEIFGVVARRSKKEKSAAKSAPAPATQTTSDAAPVAIPAVQSVAAPMSDDAVVAAITAALAVYLEAEGTKAPAINGFRVVSFKKVGTAAHWNQN